MSENNHTEGEWKINPDNKIICVGDKDEDVVASFSWTGGEPVSENWKANADLISAAPDMLEALKTVEFCITAYDDTQGLMKDVQRAIAKANGELEKFIAWEDRFWIEDDFNPFAVVCWKIFRETYTQCSMCKGYDNNPCICYAR